MSGTPPSAPLAYGELVNNQSFFQPPPQLPPAYHGVFMCLPSNNMSGNRPSAPPAYGDIVNNRSVFQPPPQPPPTYCQNNINQAADFSEEARSNV